MEKITKSQSISTLQRPVWLDAAGMSKGIGHDRQHLGIILGAGQRMRIRQTNDAFTEELTLRLLNDDSKTEISNQVGKSWIEVSLDKVSVPFVDTPYVKGEPKIEFEYSASVKALPVYHKGENEISFFKSWDAQDAEYALINSEYLSILTPRNGKNSLKCLGKVKNIDGLIQYYEDIFTFYNSLAGLSFEAESDTDRNITNRYFMKADKHGAGAAYYGGNWTAESTNSVSNYWLDATDNNWGNLHEIAHGYQGHFMGDKYFKASEVWNNIYCACYQDIILGDRKYKEGWLYDYGNMSVVEKTIKDFIQQGKPVNDWSLRYKLYFIMLMVDKAGKVGFTHFNQQYRKVSNVTGFVPSDHPLLDMLSESFAHSGNMVDVTPFIQLVGGRVSPSQVNRNYFSHAKAVYPLYQLVKTEDLEKVKGQLKLESTLTLVDSMQLKATGLKSNVTLHLNIDDFSQIFGEALMLMEGSRYICKTPINSPEMVLKDLPIGVYTLRLPTGKDKKYQPLPTYLVLKQGENVRDVNFTQKVSSSIVSQEINLLGLGDGEFASVFVDQAKQVVTIDVTTTSPHCYFHDEIYARVIVKNTEGVVIFNVDIPGTKATIIHKELPFTFGHRVEIYHEEPRNRVQVSPAYSDVIDNKSKINTLLITRSGLKNVALNGDPDKGLMARLEKAVLKLHDYPQALNAEFSPLKDDIYLAINTLSSPRREELLTLHQKCIPSKNDAPGDKVGNAFSVALKGIGDYQFLTATIDLVKKELAITIGGGIAHNYFTDTYASINYVDEKGKELFTFDVIGNQKLEPQSLTLPISGFGGEVVYIRHEEPKNRLSITNEMQKVSLADCDKEQAFRITTMGLERINDYQKPVKEML